MGKSFYIQVRGKRQGPFTVERLQQMAKRGRFGRQHRVSTDGRSWRPADEFPELFEAQGERKMRQRAATASPAAAPGAAPGDPASVAPATPSSQGWYYSHDGQQLGPVSMEVLKHAHSTNTLKADDLVWTNGMTEWKRADKALPGLFSGEAAAAGPSGVTSVGPEGAPVSAHAEMSNMALYSLLLAFIPVIGSIAAVICGHKALGDIDRSGGEMEGRNLALGGLVLGYGVLAAGVLLGLYQLSSGALQSDSGWKPQLQDTGSNDAGSNEGRPGFVQPPNKL